MFLILFIVWALGFVGEVIHSIIEAGEESVTTGAWDLVDWTFATVGSVLWPLNIIIATPIQKFYEHGRNRGKKIEAERTLARKADREILQIKKAEGWVDPATSTDSTDWVERRRKLYEEEQRNQAAMHQYLISPPSRVRY